MKLTPSIERFIAHFAELGPRWGLNAETCRAHALLYLAGRPMSLTEIARALRLDKAKARAAIDDLVQWGMAQSTDNETWDASGEPWDLLCAALDARRRREIEPALAMLRSVQKAAAGETETFPGVRARIAGMRELAENLAAIDMHAHRVPKRAMLRLVTLGGHAARILDRLLPASRPRRSA